MTVGLSASLSQPVMTQAKERAQMEVAGLALKQHKVLEKASQHGPGLRMLHSVQELPSVTSVSAKTA